jgi:hypothetical protein
MAPDMPPPPEQSPDAPKRVCMNCEHMLWGVALGVGVRCGHPANKKDGKLFKIPYRNYSCEHFEPRPRQDPTNPEG